MACKGITATVLFESSALNRDEKIGGSVLSIKKLAREHGVFSYFSRPSIRHHLFTTLQYQCDWEPAPVSLAGDSNNKVIQFDFPEANILSYPELDVFGYMNTSAGGRPTRKAPLGITKAVSVEAWQADMSFGANHDMVARLRQVGEKAEPNPYSKEEHYSFYRVSFTLDLCRFGYDEYLYEADQKSPEPPKVLREWLDNYTRPVTEKEVREHAGWAEDKIFSLGEGAEWRKYSKEEQNIGYVGIFRQIGKMVFIVADEERKKRLTDVLSVLKNGIMLHGSGECYGINPQFIIIGCLTVPVPVFHNFVSLKNGTIAVDDLGMVIRENDYVLRAFVSSVFPCDKLLENGAPKVTKGIDIQKILSCCLENNHGEKE
ncbi:CRISPR-associated regulatory protein, DevR family [Desulfofundulus kuznetsovii DSM 6115]|uniref:CRISPR-associated regulatory protein, DevR family n=1 Tax=Desulfofundulus kuznetsovii (strain DSM 6115 / VKM B-1805 / 17) TaxID=760568 RepID=A0AAU8PNI8_DESK7|nr:CRISPR-associated regulatory protein, DevR family [Desulfofundulus kuznetsovii DSM 6115]